MRPFLIAVYAGITLCTLLLSLTAFAEKASSDWDQCKIPSQDPKVIIKVCTHVVDSDAVNGKMALSYRGLAYVEEHDSDKAIQDFNQFLQSFPNAAGTLVNRARAEAEKGDSDSAIQDLKNALRLEPNNVAAYAGFSFPYMAKGDFKSAAETLDQAIQRMPDIAGLFYQRGIAKMYFGDNQAAISDLQKASALDPSNPYKIIWLHLAHLKAGQPDDQEFQINAGKYPNDKWPASVAALYLAKATTEQVFMEAQNPYQETQQEQICEAHFYVGTFYLQKAMKDKAKEEFEYTSKNCPRYLIEQALAQTHLKSLPQ